MLRLGLASARVAAAQVDQAECSTAVTKPCLMGCIASEGCMDQLMRDHFVLTRDLTRAVTGNQLQIGCPAVSASLLLCTRHAYAHAIAGLFGNPHGFQQGLA